MQTSRRMTTMPHRNKLRAAAAMCLTLLWCLGMAAPAQAAPFDPESPADPAIDWPMYRDPEIPFDEWQVKLQPNIAELWRMGLERNDADMNIAVSKDIVTAADIDQAAMKPLAAALLALVENQERGWSVRAAAARALGAIDATDTAEKLLSLAGDSTTEMTLACDAALAKWKHAPAEAMWRQRALDASASVTLRVSAVNALHAAGFASAAEDLASLAFATSTPVPVQLAAGEALGVLVDSGLESQAAGLLQAPAIGVSAAQLRRTRQVTVARALRRHTSDAAVTTLLGIVREGDDAAAAIAATSLLANRPEVLNDLASNLAARNDATLRALAVQALLNVHSNAAVGTLGDMLADAHPQVRGAARKALQELDADTALRPGVRAKVKSMLSSAHWQGIEQATLLLGLLGDRSATDTLARQLTHERWEVRMASIAAVRWLDIRDLAPTMVARVDTILSDAGELTQAMGASSAESREIERSEGAKEPSTIQRLEILALQREKASRELRLKELEMMQLLQTLGRMKAAVAEPLARRLVPKGSIMFGDARGAGIWALGLMKEGQLDTALAAQLTARLNDVNDPMNPEFDIVRQFSAVALGRMNAEAQLPSLREHAGVGPVGHSARWSILQITGEPLEPLKPSTIYPPDWILMPLNK